MRWLLLVGAVSSVGCAQLVGVDDWNEVAPTLSSSGVSSTATTGAGLEAGGAGGGGGETTGGGGGDAGCVRHTNAYPVVADVAILPGGTPEYPCDMGAEPSINYGLDPLANVGEGRALLRFALDEESIHAIATGIADVELEVWRAAECNCAAPGTFGVYPMMNDWREGTMSAPDVDGATWCEADPLIALRWDEGGAKGTKDHGPPAGGGYVPAADASVKWPLSLSGTEWLDETKEELSLLVAPEDTGVFVIATRENNSAKHPVLRVSWCAE